MTRRTVSIKPRVYQAYQRKDLDILPELRGLPPSEILAMKAVSAVLPFRTNNYVVEELIRWDEIPEDPIYQLTFPQKGMLTRKDFKKMIPLIQNDSPPEMVAQAALEIQKRLNPHPAGQRELNVPTLRGKPLQGVQHKYRETVLFFPEHGQTCHAYCTYCFRWAQFVGNEDLKFSNNQIDLLVDYLLHHEEVRNVLFTGGDPLIMKTSVLRRYIEPLLIPELENLTAIRIGTKATAYWPYRFLTDSDADDLLRLFEEVVASGKHLALMAHYSHPRELETREAKEAIRRIHGTGAVIRCQSPIVRHVNDTAGTWAQLWRDQESLGAIPYYMFVERDTGPRNYFEIPLLKAYEVFQGAYHQISGLGRTVRGPVMSATPGKVVIDAICELAGEKVFSLKFIQGRNPDWVGKPFFARFDPKATWFDQLRPAFGAKKFFFDTDFSHFEKEVVDSSLNLLHSPRDRG